MPEIEGSYSWIRSQASSILQAQIRAVDPYSDVWVWVKDVFPDVLVAEFESYDYTNGEQVEMYSFPYTVEGDQLSLGEGTPVKMDYVAKRREEARKASAATRKGIANIDIAGPVVKTDELEGTVYAAVLVPGEEDLNGEPPLTKAEVRKYAHSYAPYQLVDSEHNFEAGAGRVVETFLIPDGVTMKNDDGDELPEGSWVLGTKPEPEHLEKFLSGEYGGLSLAGFNREFFEGVAGKSEGEGIAAKNLLLKDLEDPVIGFVSYVKSPAVPKGKTFAIKGETGTGDAVAQERPGLLRSLFSARAYPPAKTEKEVQQTEEEEVTDVKAEVRAALKEAGVIQEEPSEIDKLRGDVSELTGTIKGLVETLAGQGAAKAEEEQGEPAGQKHGVTNASTDSGYEEKPDSMSGSSAQEDDKPAEEPQAKTHEETITKTAREIELENEVSELRGYMERMERAVAKASGQSIEGEEDAATKDAKPQTSYERLERNPDGTAKKMRYGSN